MSQSGTRLLKRNEVPKYLHESERFKAGMESAICVPEDCVKPHLHIKNITDLEDLLRTMQYWGLTTLPQQLVDVLFCNKNATIEELLLKYDNTFPRLVPFLKDFDAQKDTDWCAIAAEHGMLEFLHYFVERKAPLDFYAVRLAAENGHLSCLNYLHSLYARTSKPIDYKTFNYIHVIEHGHVNVLQFLVEHGRPISENMCAHAAKCGQLTCLHYLLERSPLRSVHITTAAAASNNVHCLQYTVERRCTVGMPTWQAASACKSAHNLQFLFTAYPSFVVPVELANIACRTGSVDCLRLLYEHGCPGDKSAITAAAEGGSFECLQFLQNELEFDCWVPATMAAAAGANQVKLLQKLLDTGCPGDYTVIAAAVATSAKACLLYLVEQGKMKWN